MVYPQSENERYWSRVRLFGGLTCGSFFAWRLVRAVQAESVLGVVISAAVLMACLRASADGVRQSEQNVRVVATPESLQAAYSMWTMNWARSCSSS